MAPAPFALHGRRQRPTQHEGGTRLDGLNRQELFERVPSIGATESIAALLTRKSKTPAVATRAPLSRHGQIGEIAGRENRPPRSEPVAEGSRLRSAIRLGKIVQRTPSIRFGAI